MYWISSRRRRRGCWRRSRRSTPRIVVERLISGAVETALGTRLVRARPMGGGCIGEVYEAELSEGSKAVAKVDRAGESHLEREAYMLRYLGDKSDLPVPKVYHHSEKLLLMEFVGGGGARGGAAGRLARYNRRSLRPRARHPRWKPLPAEPVDGELGRVLPGPTAPLPRRGGSRGWQVTGGATRPPREARWQDRRVVRRARASFLDPRRRLGWERAG